MENLLADETMKDMVVPVNVHIPGSKPDYMYPPVGEYAGMLALEGGADGASRPRPLANRLFQCGRKL